MKIAILGHTHGNLEALTAESGLPLFFAEKLREGK
jgi:hypothetical protein